MRKHILFFLLPLLLMGLKSKGQDSLIISPYSIIMGNDSVVNGTTDSIKFRLLNISSTTFSDSGSIYISVQDSVSGFIFHPIDSLYFASMTIPSGDSSAQMTLYVDYTIAPLRFHYDINVIVIWPLTASSTFVLDSIYYLEFIDTLADGVDEIDLSKYIRAFPNPVVNHLSIENTGKKHIEEVRIYDTTGRLIQREEEPDFICTETWKKGTYLIKVTLSDKRTHSIRVVKQ